MPYFSRLTDIVVCNLTDLLARESDPGAAIRRIISEIEDGVTGAKRSVAAAAGSEQRLAEEMKEHQAQIGWWGSKAREELQQQREDQARYALCRKREIEDLVAALQQQAAAAASTREQLATTLRGLEVRLAEALRKQQELATRTAVDPSLSSLLAAGTTISVGEPADVLDESLTQARAAEIEAELQALKRELTA